MNAVKVTEITSCLDHICKQAFSVLAGMDAMTVRDLPSAVGPFACRISIKNDQGSQKHVFILADSRFAVRFARGMFATSENDVNDEDVADAIGELANTIGGNLKGIMEGETNLSLPELFFSSPLCRGVPETELGFRFIDAGECVVEVCGA